MPTAEPITRVAATTCLTAELVQPDKAWSHPGGQGGKGGLLRVGTAEAFQSKTTDAGGLCPQIAPRTLQGGPSVAGGRGAHALKPEGLVQGALSAAKGPNLRRTWYHLWPVQSPASPAAQGSFCLRNNTGLASRRKRFFLNHQ